MCCACVVGANSSQVRLDRSSDISVLNGIAPQMPLLIVKRIFTFWIAGSGTSFSNVPTIFSAKLTKVWGHNLRNREMRTNPVIQSLYSIIYGGIDSLG